MNYFTEKLFLCHIFNTRYGYLVREYLVHSSYYYELNTVNVVAIILLIFLDSSLSIMLVVTENFKNYYSTIQLNNKNSNHNFYTYLNNKQSN